MNTSHPELPVPGTKFKAIYIRTRYTNILADILDCVDLQVVSSNNVSETVSVSFLM
jgi:hypothetical protein